MKETKGKYGLIVLILLSSLMTATLSFAAVDRVICVPWQGNPLKFHTAVSGEDVRLKGVIKTTDTSTVWYKWVFGDGSESPVSSLSGSMTYKIKVDHPYTGAVGTPFTAQLLVDDVDDTMSNAVADPYLVKIEQDNLDARINIAIDDGLWWLFTNNYNHSYLKTYDGSPFMAWRQWSHQECFASPTSSAIQAFAINNHKINGDPDEDPYVEAVQFGMNWLLQGYRYDSRWPMLHAMGMALQHGDDPDGNGNGYGIQVRDYGNRPIYQGGQIMDAIIASGVQPGDDTGRDFVGRGANWTFGELLQDMCDMYAWGQVDGGNARGGWQYSWNSGSDNSAAQWAAIGMIPAQEAPWNCIVPDWVKTENAIWLNYSYNSGHFGYTSANSNHDWYTNTTPSGMVQMAMDGQVGYDDPATPEDERDPKWVAAERYMVDNWDRMLHNSSYSWRDGSLMYGWYAFAKAMRLAVPQPVARATRTDGTSFDWYTGSGGTKGMAQRIVETQASAGSWDGSLIDPPITTAWMVIILRPSLFAASPVACFTAEPNPTFPDRDVIFDPSCSTHSETEKDIANLTLFEWDWDEDGVYDESTTAPETATHAFECAVLPCTYPVTLKVTDDEGLTATYTLDINITEPPHPPVAGTGGPYLVSLSDLDSLTLDGSGSYELDEGQHQSGCPDCPDDRIIVWDWDLSAPLTGFDDVSGEVPTLSWQTVASLLTPGTHTIALRVTDNTQLAFPDSGEPNLTDVGFGTVEVYQAGMRDIRARPKDTKCQLTWTHIGAGAYKVFRSEEGPNTGFEQIGTTTSTYSTFLDYNLVEGLNDPVNTCKGDFDDNAIVDEADAAVFAAALGFTEGVGGYNVIADFDGDGDVDGGDAAFFAAEAGRTDCLQTTGIELDKDYWYRVQADTGGESILSVPVFINSQGLITNYPPVISSTAVTSAQDDVLYQYDVEASDPEGQALAYTLDLAPAGMDIDANTGLISWTPDSHQLGPNDVMVRVTDADGVATSQFFTVFVATGPNTAPTVVAGGPYSGLVDDVITFNGGGSSDPDGDGLMDFHWIFGDGTDAHGLEVTHTYPASGLYSVTLHITDSRGRTGHGTTSCQIGNPNRPPIAIIGGPAVADAGTVVIFDGSQSYDPDNDTLTYAWDFGGGETATGPEATHTYPDPGDYTVSLTVSDGRGGLDTVKATLTVESPNVPPIFGAPAFTVTGDLLNTIELTFTADCSDPDSDYLEYAWTFGDGASENGQVVTHTYDAPNDYTITVIVDDGRGGSVSASQTITIAQIPNRPPVAEAGGPYEGDLAGGTSVNVVLVGAGSSDPDGDDLDYSWGYGGTTYSGQTVSINFNTVGWHDVELTVTEDTADGFSDTDVARVLVKDSTDINPPTAIITTPDSSSTIITEKIDVVGTVDDAEHFVGYTLEISGEKDSGGNWINWTTLAEGTTPVNDGVLGVLDPTALRNDFYRLRVRASDGSQETSSWIEVKVAGELKFGNLKMSFIDLKIPVAGIPITITRTYDSFKKSKDDFGYGWALDINNAEIKEDVNHNVFITLPDGRRVSFGFAPVRLSPWFPGWDVRFIAPPGVYAELDFVGEHLVNQSADGDWYWFSGVFDPDDYILKTKDGRVYDINQQDGIQKVTDRNGNALTIDENGITHTSGKSITFTRDGEGRIERITNPAGNDINYTYNANGDLISVTYPEGYVMAFEYNDSHFITKMIDPEGRAVQQNEYDASGRLIASTNDEGATVTFIHDMDNKTEKAIDARGNLSQATFNDNGVKTEEIDQLGNRKLWAYDENQNITEYEVRDASDNLISSMGFEYDGQGNPTRMTLPDGTRYEIAYNEAHKWTNLVMPDGGTLNFEYDAKYNLSAMTEALGNQTSFTYDALGNRTSATDAMGRTTLYAYDAYGNLTGVTDPCGGVHTYTRDDFGNVLTYTRPDGATVTNAYDSMGRLIRTTDPLGNSKRYEYDSRGNRSAEIDERGYRTTYAYNSKDKVTAIVYPDGSKVSVSYDENGNRVEIIDVSGGVRSFTHDKANRMSQMVDPLGNVTTYEYDGAGYVSALTDTLGNTTVYTRDSSGRVVGVKDAKNGETKYTYNVAGKLTSVTDATAKAKTMEYDALYRLIREVLPGGQQTQYVYDAVGNRVERRDANGATTAYAYDSCDRLAQVTYPDGAGMSYTHDVMGNRLSMTDTTGTTNYAYDVLQRLVSVARPSGASIAYQYDAVGNILSVTDPVGKTEKIYDSNNRLSSVVDRDGGTTNYAYGAGRRVSSVGYPNGVASSYSWDVASRITNIQHSTGNSVAYQYDALGNVISKNQDGILSQYVYDSLGRIVENTKPGTQVSYAYDKVGNRLSMTENGVTTNFTYNISDQLTAPRAFDGNGNLVSDGFRTYEYDFENRLTKVMEGATVIAQYQYDGDGNRVSATSAGVTTSYLVDTNARLPVVLLEQQGATTVATYTHGMGIISMKRGGNSSYFMKDALDSTTGLTDGAGDVTDTYEYDPFGNTIGTSGTTENPYRFTGEPFNSETGLYYLRARFYNPALGVFLGRDPAQGNVLRPMTFHPYMYGNANPLKYVDHTGRQAIMTYAVTVINNPLQWGGAFLGGMGAGYTSTTLGFLTEVLKNAGKPMGEVIGNGLLGMFMRFNLLDCGQLALTAGIKNSALGATLQLGHKLLYYAGENAANGNFGITHAQFQEAAAGVAENLMRMAVQIPRYLGIAAGGGIAQFGVGGAVFTFFDAGKTLGGLMAIMNVVYAMGGFS